MTAPGKRKFLSAHKLLRKHGLAPKKALGQNFLVDDNIRSRIVDLARVGPADVVVEIGSGLGALTIPLARQAGKVIALEVDRALAFVLASVLDEHGIRNVEQVTGDALDFDFVSAALSAGRPLVVVGNLPYQVTSPVLFKVLEAADAGRVISRALFMMQKEVAERLTAPPGHTTYGRLSVTAQQYAEVRPVLKVGARVFLPPPAVLSTVVELVPRRAPLAAVRDPGAFEAVVRAAFSGRRKMLRNALEGEYGREATVQALASAGVDGTRRAETVSVAEFARICNALGEARVHLGETASHHA